MFATLQHLMHEKSCAPKRNPDTILAASGTELYAPARATSGAELAQVRLQLLPQRATQA